MKLHRAGLAAGLIAGALALGACSSSATSPDAGGSSTPTTNGGSSTTSTTACSTGTLKAEGSTAQTNAINAWIKAYQDACPGSTINYNPTGSGAGISSFTGGQVDFAGSDSALDPSKGEPAAAEKQCGSPALDLPMVVGPIALAYKLNGVDKLILNGEVTAKIFLGKITTWDDPALAAINPGVTLPSTKISVVYRSDSSGTTQNFEKYLAATAPEVFTSKPDKDSSKAGFTGQGKAKSQGVADAIAATEGAIGYDEFSFAVASGLSTAEVDNGSGPVALTKETAATAAGSAKITGTGNDLTLQLDYATKVPGAYPLILVTYEVACSKYADPAKAAFVKNFLTYAASTGQAGLAQLGYAPLPTDLQAKVEAAVASIS